MSIGRYSKRALIWFVAGLFFFFVPGHFDEYYPRPLHILFVFLTSIGSPFFFLVSVYYVFKAGRMSESNTSSVRIVKIVILTVSILLLIFAGFIFYMGHVFREANW